VFILAWKLVSGLITSTNLVLTVEQHRVLNTESDKSLSVTSLHLKAN
jgi:hypothetical protein